MKIKTVHQKNSGKHLTENTGRLLISIISLFAIIISAIFDFSHEDYWHPLFKLIFSRETDDFTNIGTFIIAIWTVSTTLIVFFLGLANDRRYGIKILDLVLTGQNAVRFLIIQAGAFLAQLSAAIWAILYQMEITITICLFMQIIWMIYFFHMICSTLSEHAVRKKITEDALCQDGRLLNRMMQNIRYDDMTEIENVFGIFTEIGAGGSNNEITSDRRVCNLAGSLTINMLEDASNSSRALSITGKWLETLEKHQSQYNSHIKHGIIEGILDRIYEPYCPEISEIFDSCILAGDRKRKLIMWGLTYTYFSMDKTGRGYRVYPASDELINLLDPPLNEKDTVTILDIWHSFLAESDPDTASLNLNLKQLWRLIPGGGINEP